MEHNPDRLYRGPVGYLLEPIVRVARGHGFARNHRWVWWAHRAVWRLTRSNRVRVEGFELELDMHDSLQLARGSYEAAEVAWYKEHVQPGDLVLELGGNIGYFTCLFARLAGPDGRVIAYEPDPMLRAIALRNLANNGFADRAEVRQAAVADEAGRLRFYRAGRNYGNNSLFRYQADSINGKSFEVDVVTLDEDLADLTEPFDFVKMDIQGAEPLALAGMEQILRERPARRMLLEFWPTGLVGLGREPREMLDVLDAAGYRVCEMGSDEPIDPDDVLRRFTPDNALWVNLDCTHVATAGGSVHG